MFINIKIYLEEVVNQYILIYNLELFGNWVKKGVWFVVYKLWVGSSSCKLKFIHKFILLKYNMNSCK